MNLTRTVFALSLLSFLEASAYSKMITPGATQQGIGFNSTLNVSNDGNWLILSTTKGRATLNVSTNKVVSQEPFLSSIEEGMAWSPTAAVLAVQENREGKIALFLRDMEKNTEREVLVYPKALTQLYGVIGPLIWAPDGKVLYSVVSMETPRWRTPPSHDAPYYVGKNGKLFLAGDYFKYTAKDFERPIKKQYPDAYAEQMRTLILAIDVESGEARLVLEGNDIRDLYPSPDGRWLLFTQTKSEKDQRRSHEPRQKYSDVYLLPCPRFSQLPKVDLSKYEDRDAGNRDHLGRRFDPVLVDLEIVDYWRFGVGSNDGNGYNPRFSWAPDSSKFAYATSGIRSTGDVFIHSLKDGVSRNLTDKFNLPELAKGNQYANNYRFAYRSKKFGNIYAPMWMPDGKALLVLGKGDAWFIPVDEPQAIRRLTGRLPEEVFQILGLGTSTIARVGADGDIAVMAKNQHTRLDTVWKVNVWNDSCSRIAATGLWTNMPKLADSQGRYLIYSGQTERLGSNIYRLDLQSGGAPVQLTKFKQELLQFDWPQMKVLEWKTTVGGTGGGILFLPRESSPERPVPLFLQSDPGAAEKVLDRMMAHGPRWMVSSSHDRDFAYANVLRLLDMGIAVLIADIPLSEGGVYDSPTKQIVDGLQVAIEHVLATGHIDKSRMAIYGARQEGTYMVQAALSEGIPFKTGICVSQGVGFGANLFETSFNDLQGWSPANFYYALFSSHTLLEIERGFYRMEVPLWDARQQYLENTALANWNRVKSPLLLISLADPRALNLPDPNRQTFNASRRLGLSVVWSRTGPRHMVSTENGRIFGWLNEHLLGGQPTAHSVKIPESYLTDGVVSEEDLPADPSGN